MPSTAPIQASPITPAISASALSVQQADDTKRAIYIVRLEGAPIASYRGEISGLPATSPSANGQAKLNMKSSAVQAYRAHLARQRQAVLGGVTKIAGGKLALIDTYDVALNGFAVELSAAEARQVAKLPGVVHIAEEEISQLETDAGPTWIKAPQVWSGEATNLFVTTINGAHEVPSTGSAATGKGTFSLSGSTLTYQISTSGATFTAAHIHRGVRGENGVVAHALTQVSPGMYAGSVTLAPADLALLRSGGLYANFHSAAFPGGEVRGQLTGSMGEGMLVGILDSGINFSHPSFAATGGDGYTHVNPFGAGVYKGVCDPASSQYQAGKVCNAKLVGAYTWPSSTSGASPEDDNGHGTHTASTTAGNVITSAVVLGINVGQISGVAPHANIIAFDVCSTGCAGAATVSSVEESIELGVDVLNYSIGSNGCCSDPWANDTHLSFLAARDAGIFISNSAGNNGSASQTIFSSNPPWVAAVGATEHNRAFLGSVTNMTGGTNPPPTMLGKALVAGGVGPAPIVFAGAAPYNNRLCQPFAAGTFSGQIVVCDRGTNGRVEKGQNVLNAGGGGMILLNDLLNAAAVQSDLHVLPAVHLSFAQGVVLKNWLNTGVGHTATLTGRVRDLNSPYADMITGFSSRGPARISASVLLDVVKPDLSAPGVDIIAAYNNDGNAANGHDYGMISGTSMAAPHNAGAATLVMQIHPDWSPAEVQSALMMTSIRDGVRRQDNVTAANPFDRGAGRIDVSRAVQSGLVMHETGDNYFGADPLAGGKVNTLNLPSFQDSFCVVTCSWTRTVSNTLGVPATWTSSFTSTNGVAMTVSPASFTIPAHSSQVFTVTANIAGKPLDAFYFADVVLTEATNKAPSVTMPVAVRGVISSVAALDRITTLKNVGATTSDSIKAAVNVTALTIRQYGLTKATIDRPEVAEDPTNSNAYDNLTLAGGIYTKTVTIPAGTKRFVVDVFATESEDTDLFVHRDGAGGGTVNGVPTANEQVCTSATGSATEYCNMNDPVAGTYIIVVQNWTGSPNAPDLISVATTVVPAVDAGNWTVTGPATVPAGTPFTLNVSWNLPASESGDRWYGAYDVGSDAANAGNLGRTNVDLVYQRTLIWLPLISKQ